MSASETKTVTFQAKKKKSPAKINPAPEQVSMAGGPGGAERPAKLVVDAKEGVVVDSGTLATTPLRSAGAVDEQFPTAALSKSDPRDAIQTAKLELQAEAAPGVTKFGKLVATDSDFEWLRSKREKEAEANFQQWFASNFDHMSPEQKQMARELWPEFYEQRLELLRKQVNLQQRIAELKVSGIKNKDDLMLQYAIEAGFIDADPLENILHPERVKASQDLAARQKKYVRGLFNPRRLPRGDWGPNDRAHNAQTLMGKSAAAFGSVPAYELGTGDKGFSAVGTVSAAEERNPNFARQYRNIFA